MQTADFLRLLQTQNEFAPFDVLEISHSSMSAFDSCPRKFEFRKMHNCSLREETLPTKGGKAFHTGLQTYLATKDVDKGLFELIWEFDMQWQTSPMKPRSLEAYVATYLHTINNEKLSEYELAKIKTVDGKLMDATEVGFAIEIENYPFYPDGKTITVRYIGFIDAIMYSKITDHYMCWDIKTTTKEIDHDTEYHFDEQQIPYGLALEAILGVQCAHNFDVAYWVNRIDVLEPKSLFYCYTRTTKDVQDWVRGLFRNLQEIKTFTNAGWFRRKGNACAAYNRKCTYFDFCESRDTKVINIMLEQHNANVKREALPAPVVTIKIDAREGF